MNIALAGAGIVGAYLIGAIPSGLLIGKAFAGIDLREHGSNNIGFTNAMRVLGWKLGLPVLILDVGKALLTVLFLPGYLAPEPTEGLRVAIGVAVLVGNLINVFLGFKGGKGVATAAGVFLALSWPALLIALGVFLLTLAMTRYVSLGSIVASITLPTAVFFLIGLGPLFAFTALASAGIIFKHRTNIRRLLDGTEAKVSRKKASEATS